MSRVAAQSPERCGTRAIESIVVLGGGTAGWITAAMLERALRKRAGPKPPAITVVESSAIPTVGVGEATVPTLRRTLKKLEIDERDFFVRVGATFKNGIRFVGWRTGSDEFWHPFGPRLPSVEGHNLALHWCASNPAAGERLDERCSPTVGLSRRNLAPKSLAEGPYRGAIEYAYHVDAGKLAAYLRELATARGVRHVVDTVDEVSRTEDGSIAALVTREHGQLTADLYVDCSGFRASLIHEILREPFVSFGASLLCDRAIAISARTDGARDGLAPYTTATALSAGWAWCIPLYDRSGVGYVYSSRFLDDDGAERELRAHVGPSCVGAPARRIRMRVGRSRRTWVQNCVAVGLSGGFIEPLESTGIFFIELAAMLLADELAANGELAESRERFNARTRRMYESVLDYIVLHYCTTERSDTPFWRANRSELAIPESLMVKLRAWRHEPLHFGELCLGSDLFGLHSYAFLLAGMGLMPRRGLEALGAHAEAAARCRAELEERERELAAELPDQYRYLAALRDVAVSEPASIADA